MWTRGLQGLLLVGLGGGWGACSGSEPAPAESSASAEPNPVTARPPAPPTPEAEAPACGPAKWCGPRSASKRIAVTSLPRSLGCPATIGGDKLVRVADAPEYAGLEPGTLDFDPPATRAKRGQGDAQTCCYARICGLPDPG